MTYLLHYAPDNASMIVRLALDHAGLSHETRLVDRAARAHEGPAYRALNPHGLIPTLETPDGPIFETGAILLYLTDRHAGLGPAADAPTRGDFLKWLFYLSNTLHPAERMLFYPEKYIASDQAEALRTGIKSNLRASFDRLEEAAQTAPFAQITVLHFYLASLLRWPALYPSDSDRSWFDLKRYPALHALCATVETLPATASLQEAEGMGPRPFTAPQPPTPPEGSAT
ncbi:MAG: glutathione S-transferase family protein [Sulfitobacter sp.]|nr:glutathione S-transferase family protein [Sulfitobacter sp.]